MKVLFKVTMAVLASALLVNCKATVQGEGRVYPGEPIPLPYEYSYDEIDYSDGGWYGPYPNYRLRLNMRLDDGVARVTVDTPNCFIQGTVRAVKFFEIHDLVLSARHEKAAVHFIDGGDEKITLSGDDISETHFLKLGDSTHNKYVIVEEDAKEISESVDLVAQALIEGGKCQISPNDK